MAKTTMTRAQAICACRNIADLAKTNERVPWDMAEGITDRVTSMEASITEKSQFPTITENMDRALRNMWQGLRRWDRDDEYNTDIFDELEEVEGELADYDASGENRPPPKGREVDDEASKARAASLAKAPPVTALIGKDAKAVVQSVTDEARQAIDKEAVQKLLRNTALHGKEAAIEETLRQLDAAGITIIEKVKIRHKDISEIMCMTTSVRTQQLIKAAYFVGVLRGVGALYGKLTSDEK